MKKLFFAFLASFIFVACERTDCCVQPKIELQGKFTHQIPDCTDDSNIETNCTEWFEFVNTSEVDLQYGGLDFVQRFTLTYGSDFIELQGPATSSFHPIFTILNDSILERIDTGDLWKKE